MGSALNISFATLQYTSEDSEDGGSAKKDISAVAMTNDKVGQFGGENLQEKIREVKVETL